MCPKKTDLGTPILVSLLCDDDDVNFSAVFVDHDDNHDDADDDDDDDDDDEDDDDNVNF